MTNSKRVRTYMNDMVVATVNAKYADDGTTIEGFEVHQFDPDANETVERRTFPATDPLYQAKAFIYANLCVDAPYQIF